MVHPTETVSSNKLSIKGHRNFLPFLVNAPHVIINGELNGNIDSAEHVELSAECRMIGNINTGKIAIADGKHGG